MNAVEPIKDVGIINDIVDYLREKSDRNALLFLYGIYSGLRISDIRVLRVRDVRNKERYLLEIIKILISRLRMYII